VIRQPVSLHRPVIIALILALPVLMLIARDAVDDGPAADGQPAATASAQVGLAGETPPAPVEPAATGGQSTSVWLPPDPSPTPQPAGPPIAPTPNPTSPPLATAAPPTPTRVPSDRLVIPGIGVDAPVVPRGLNADMTMQTPDDPLTVAWYTFTASPGSGGNAVFAGHVDHVAVGHAVFWDLRKVAVGDVVEFHALNGAVLRYTVSTILTARASDPANDVVAPTAQDMLTLITCSGSFDRASRQYDARLIVRAVRQP
jgi:LPXTG-site transpeptidase (sortase) family protein